MDFFERTVVAVSLLIFAPIVCLLPIVLGSLFERRLVWPCLAADELDWPAARLSRRAEAANRDLAAREFAPVGTLYNGLGRGYRTRYDFWLSADRAVLAVVVGGREFRITAVDGVWLLTRLADDRYLSTVNGVVWLEPDLVGLQVKEGVPDADVAKLLARHRERIGGRRVVPYPPDDPVAELAAFERRRVELLVAAGYAAYVDDELTAWKYTPKGSVWLSLGMWRLILFTK